MDGQAEFVRAQQVPLLRAAYLLTGSKAAAQDLVQETLVRVLVAWRRVQAAQVPEAYVRRVLLMTFLSESRRAWRRRERATAHVPELVAGREQDVVDDRDALRRALLSLPPRQRAAVVLRHYQDLSEAQTAEVLGCSIGNVKALTSRGLAALRVSMTGEACHDRRV